MTNVYPAGLLWVDYEADSLPVGRDFSEVGILEIGAIITDFDLKKYAGFHGVVKLEAKHVAKIKSSPEVLEMHTKSNLLQDCAKSTNTVKDLEDGVIEMIKERKFQKRELVLAGSGIAMFDFPLMWEKMPNLAEWVTPFPLDLGIMRRGVRYLSGKREFVPHVDKSTTNKAHRGFDDVVAHIEEAELYRDWLRGL